MNIVSIPEKRSSYQKRNYIITDVQVVTRYDDVENNDVSQLTKQTINYSFYKKNGNDTYQLDYVFHRNKVK